MSPDGEGPGPAPPPCPGRASAHCLGIAHPVPKLGFCLVIFKPEGTPGQGAGPDPEIPTISHLCLVCIAGMFFTYCLIFFFSHLISAAFQISPENPAPPPVSRPFTALPHECTRSIWLPAPLLASVCVSATWEVGGTPSTSCSSPLFIGKREDGEKPCRWPCQSLRDPGHSQPSFCILPLLLLTVNLEQALHPAVSWGMRALSSVCWFLGPVLGAAAPRSWRVGCLSCMPSVGSVEKVGVPAFLLCGPGQVTQTL